MARGYFMVADKNGGFLTIKIMKLSYSKAGAGE
jgi:hypothetical protein